MPAAKFYDQLWSEHGPGLGSLGWSSIGAQLTRFNVLREAITGPGEVLDAGCGFGDFSVFHDEYVGVDANPAFIEEAKRKYPKKTFWLSDVMELPPDKYIYVVANGLLAYQDEPIKVIQKLWDLTANTLAFTWLNASINDINLALTMCGAPLYSIRHDYLENDTAVFMHRFPK